MTASTCLNNLKRRKKGQLLFSCCWETDFHDKRLHEFPRFYSYSSWPTIAPITEITCANALQNGFLFFGRGIWNTCHYCRRFARRVHHHFRRMLWNFYAIFSIIHWNSMISSNEKKLIFVSLLARFQNLMKLQKRANLYLIENYVEGC